MTTEAITHTTRCGHSSATAAAPCAVFVTASAGTALTDPLDAVRLDCPGCSAEHLASVTAPTRGSHKNVTRVRQTLTVGPHGAAATIGQVLVAPGRLSAPSHCGTPTH